MNFSLGLKDIFTIPITIIIALWLGLTVLLLLPKTCLINLSLLFFKNKFQRWIGPVWLVLTCFLFIELTIKVGKYLINKFKWKKFIKNAPTRLEKLSPFEKVIIVYIYKEESHTAYLPINKGSVKLLESNFIIIKTVSTVSVDPINPRVPYTLQPWVINLLDNNTELLNKLMSVANEFVKK